MPCQEMFNNLLLSGHKLTEGYFIFEDGTEMEFLSYWAGANPDQGEDGILMKTTNDGDAGSWADGYLSDYYRFICEKNW